MLDKKALRREISAKKRAMSEDLIALYSRDLAQKLFESEIYHAACSIYVYLPYNQEVRTWEICERAWADGKRVAVPKVYGDEMRFLWIEDFSSIDKGAYGIPEPQVDAPIADDEHALVIMPGLAFDRAGHRVGYGGGFYDKYLQQHPAHALVALCYPFQLFDALETEAHDIPVQLVLCADDLALVRPSEEYASEIAAYRAEFLAAGDSMDGTGALRRLEDPLDWIAHTRLLAKAETVPDQWVPSSQFICIRRSDGRMLGTIDLRHSLNDYLSRYGGNIGYSVRPSERGHGYAKWMLSAVLPHARQLGLPRVLVTCIKGNEPSRRTILAQGGAYESEVIEPDSGIVLQRYWIEL